MTGAVGAVVAAKTRVDDDFSFQIGACAGAVKALQNAYMQAKMDKESDLVRLGTAQKIISDCGAWDTIGPDLNKINTKSVAAAAVSGGGAVAGLVGTIASVNAGKVNQADVGKQKTLNTTANAMAGVGTAAGVVSTALNGSQIKAIKRMVEIAEKCESAL